MQTRGPANEDGKHVRRKPRPHSWSFFGVTYSDRIGADRALYRRVLKDGTTLFAYVTDADGRPRCEEIKIEFPHGARNVGRELAISELERAINNADQHGVRDTRTGKVIPLLALSDVPYDVPVRGSRGRGPSWPDERLAAFVKDLEDGNPTPWRLSRRQRELANLAVTRGLATPGPSDGRVRMWQLTQDGKNALRLYRGASVAASES